MLFAVHLSDGVLTGAWIVVGFLLAILMLLPAVIRIADDEIPRIALLAAAFFVSSLIHVPLGVVSVHLLLTGLLGAILGARSGLAIGVGLTLQAVLLGHGGFTALGWNIVVMTLPAWGAWWIFRGVRKCGSLAVAGFVTGSLAVVTTCIVHASVLIVAGQEDYTLLASAGILAHAPLAILEGVVLATTATYVGKVKPQLLQQPFFARHRANS